jgi:hypothetical protein
MQIILSLKKKRFLLLLLFMVASAISELGAGAPWISTAPGGTLTNGYKGNAYIPQSSARTIRGHIMFKNGITVQSSQAITWDADGILDGAITFSTVTCALQLKSDLRLGSTASVVGPGGQFTRFFSSGNTIFLGGNISVATSIYIRQAASIDTGAAGTVTIDGQGHVATFTNSNGNAFECPTLGSTITLKNMTLVLNSLNSAFSCFSGTGSNFILDNVTVRCVPYSSPVNIINGGTLTIRGQVSLESPTAIIALASTAAADIVIEKNSTLRVGKNTGFYLCNGGSINSFTMNDRTSMLHLDGCDFYTSATGTDPVTAFNLLRGTVLFENKVRIFNAYYGSGFGTDMSTAFNLGDGTSTNDVDVRVLGGAYVTVNGAMKYNHS